MTPRITPVVRPAGLGSVLAALLLTAAPATAQVPPDSLPPAVPDTLVADTVVADTLVADTLGTEGLELEGDTVGTDSLPPIIRSLPDFGRAGSDRTPGVVRWDLEQILDARAITLQELLEPVGWVLPVRGGDYGAPQHITAVGMGAGRVRVFRDGVEELPLDGSVVDLARIALAGVGSVTLRREGGEIRIELESERVDDTGEALARIAAGTGDIETNLFRGVFLNPNALGGALGVGIERIDTRGTGGDEQGTLQGVWLRYLRPVGPLTLSGELRTGTANVDATGLGYTESSRSTRTLRARAGEPGGLRGEVYWANTSLNMDEGAGFAGEAVRDARLSRTQIGARGAWDREVGPLSLWARGEARLFSGEGRSPLVGISDSLVAGVDPFDGAGRPDDRLDLDLGIEADRLGGASLRLGTDGWEDARRSVAGLRLWTAPLFGLSAFAELDRGERGWRPTFLRLPSDSVVADSVAQGFAQDPARFTDRELARVGARFALGPIDVSAAWLSTTTDSVLPLGTVDRAGLLARGGAAFAGDETTGFEVAGRLGVPLLDGFAFVGSLQQWEEEGIYRPERIYRGGFEYANAFYETGNLGIRASLLVEGRDPMLVPVADPDFVAPPETPDALPGPARVGFYQSWNAHLQIRIVTVRIFIRWENTFGRLGLEDIPGREMPGIRAMYGIRWTLRN